MALSASGRATRPRQAADNCSGLCNYLEADWKGEPVGGASFGGTIWPISMRCIMHRATVRSVPWHAALSRSCCHFWMPCLRPGRKHLPGPSPASITQPINESVLVALNGNTRREALNPANDRGVVPDNLPLSHMILQLRRPAAQEQALKALIDQMHDPQSPNFHHWLTAARRGRTIRTGCLRCTDDHRLAAAAWLRGEYGFCRPDEHRLLRHGRPSPHRVPH